MGVVTGLRLVDIIPLSDSSETNDNSEPSVAVDPVNTNELVAGAFAVFSGGVIISPYFTSIDGGTTWRPYGDLSHDDKSLAWSQDGSTLFTTTLVGVTSTTAEINTYSGTISGSDFGSPINTFNPGRDLDQPWIRTGPSDHVYVAYNDITSTGVDTARVLVSSNGGVTYTSAALDRLSGSIVQDAPAVRLAVNGATVYGAFTRWTSELDQNTSGTEVRYNADVYVVRSDSGGADGFSALGSGGLGVKVDSPVSWDADKTDGSLTLGRNRTGAPLAIAVDPTNANHVVIAYGTAPGASIDSGEVGLIVQESFDGGADWTQKFATPVTSGGIKSSLPAGSGTVTFSGGGTFKLDDSVHYGGTVAGFGVPDQLDLADIPFISGTTTVSWNQLTSGSTASGTLTVTDGTLATTANITLLGQYVAGNFHIGNDGAGGTLVTDPPVSSSDQNQLALANTQH
jgi:hypothetical protein